MAWYTVVMLIVLAVSGNPTLDSSTTEINGFGNDTIATSSPTPLFTNQNTLVTTVFDNTTMVTTSPAPLFTNQDTLFTTSECDESKLLNNITEKEFCSDLTTSSTSRISIIDTGSMSKETFQSFERVVRYVQFFLIGFAIVANICNIVVFSQQNMSSATSTILIFLSGSELGFAVCELIMSSAATTMGSSAYVSELYWTLIRWVRVFLTTVFQKSAFCFNLLVAVERCIAVTFPLRASRILRRKNPVILCTIMLFIILIVHVFNPIKMEVVRINTGPGYIYVIRNSQFYKEHTEIFESVTLAAKILFVYIPLFGCLVMNILMVVALKRHTRNRKSLHISERHKQQQKVSREVQTTVTILVSSFLFAIFSLPITTFSIVQSLVPEYGSQKQEHYLYTFMMYLSGFLALLSLSFDFIVYMILSRAFRQTFLKIADVVCANVCCYCRKRRSSEEEPGPFVVLDEKDSCFTTVQQEIDTTLD